VTVHQGVLAYYAADILVPMANTPIMLNHPHSPSPSKVNWVGGQIWDQNWKRIETRRNDAAIAPETLGAISRPRWTLRSCTSAWSVEFLGRALQTR